METEKTECFNRKENIYPKKNIYSKKSLNKFARLFFSLAETDRELTGNVERDISENKFYPNLHQSIVGFLPTPHVPDHDYNRDAK